jgi:hypothetical protein
VLAPGAVLAPPLLEHPAMTATTMDAARRRDAIEKGFLFILYPITIETTGRNAESASRCLIPSSSLSTRLRRC